MQKGLVNNGRTSVVSKAVSAEQKKELSKKLKYQRDKDRELVTGLFRYFEVPNGVLEFSYKQYREDPVETYQLFDNQYYTLPLGVAKHLNNNIAYPQYEYIKGEDVIGGFNQGYGQTAATGMRVKSKVRRCGFYSSDFLEIEDLETKPTKIIEVDTIMTHG